VDCHIHVHKAIYHFITTNVVRFFSVWIMVLTIFETKSQAMAKLISSPSIIEAAGSKPKKIEEYIGRVNSQTDTVSIAKMTSPEDIHKSKELNTKQAGDILRKMEPDKKMVVKNMLIQLANVDGVIQPEELKVILDTFFIKE